MPLQCVFFLNQQGERIDSNATIEDIAARCEKVAKEKKLYSHVQLLYEEQLKKELQQQQQQLDENILKNLKIQFIFKIQFS